MSDETYVDRHLSLVQELYERTRAGKIDWVESRYSHSFEISMGQYVLRISLIEDNDYPNDPDFSLFVADVSSGTERWIDTISNSTLRSVMDKTTPEGLNPYALLREIYQLARRKALNVD